jgi:hypothetical protein
MKKQLISLIGLCLIITMVVSSPAVAAVTVDQVIGHNFEEESWAIEFDVLSGKQVKDWTPGELSANVMPLENDPSPYRDATFYSVYLNMGQVRTAFMALTNYSWNVNNPQAQGAAPYQVLLQAFRAPGNAFVMVENVFAGLIAYQENSTIKDGVPSAGDKLYYGFSLNSEYHKHLFANQMQLRLGQNFYPVDPIPLRVSPMNLTKTIDSTTGETVFTFGIAYENMMVVWLDIEANTDMNETSQAINVNREADNFLKNLVAISALSSLNFTYTVRGVVTDTGYTNVTTSTEYDIGPITDMWVKGDAETSTANLGGNFYTLPPVTTLGRDFPGANISRYNTTASISARLSGGEGTTGFGLAMANYARIAVVQAEKQNQQAELRNRDNSTIDGEQADQNVSRMEYRLRDVNKPAFLIDFESKPDYTWNNSEVLPAPVRLYPNVRVRNPTLIHLDEMAHRYIASLVGPAIRNRIQNANANVTINVQQRGVFYAICFPQWSGLQINQDPTFVAFAEPISSTDGRRIDGFFIGGLLVIGLGMSFVLIRKFDKK